jgi:hypothetical protein
VTTFFFADRLTALLIAKRLRLLCAKCGKDWRGGHECENEKKEAGG